MSEIADFLRARYRQEAHVARLIAEKTGSAKWKADWRRLTYHHFDARVITPSGDPVFDGYGNVGSAEFVVEHDPSRVLADLDAKHALVDQLDAADPHGGYITGTFTAYDALKLLAQPFAGHPEHKGEEWAP